MDIAVVIPTYNRAKLLPQTLTAVLGQNLPPRDVVVIDDGSTDDTQAVLRRFGSAVRSVVIANSGSIAARNIGLRMTTSSLVAFCDSDDLWRPEFLQRMADLWRAEPRTCVAFGNFQIVRADRWSNATKFDEAPAGYWDGLRPLAADSGVFDVPVVERLIRFQPFFPSCCVVDRAAMLASGGWDEGVGRVVGDDFGTVLRLAELSPFGVLKTPLVGIRKHGGNFSADTRAMNLGDASILEYVLATRPSLAMYARPIRQSIARRRIDALDSAFSDGDFAAVRCIFRHIPPAFRSFRTAAKRVVAGLPVPIAARIGKLLSG